jgi:bifunctional UDP-N-acetylglucosamine pyrophosphorylase/glucosamine-1-phosphate N-acetyltransferase
MTEAAATSTNVTAVIVLAAGQGTRMKSALPKVMHPVAGRPLLWHALAAGAGIGPKRLVAVLGHGRDQVESYLDTVRDLPAVDRAIQSEQLGTGHAVECGLAAVGVVDGTVIVTYGDVPLLTSDTLTALAGEHDAAGNAVTVLTAIVADPTGYGRIVRGAGDVVEAIVEERDATSTERRIREINSGVYAFDGPVLSDALGRLTSSNDQGERYLTDVVAIARTDGRRVGSVTLSDAEDVEGVNDRVQLAAMARRLNERIVRRHQLAGVTIQDPLTTWIHVDVSIGPDTVILPGTSLEAGTSIGSDCVIGPDTTVSASTVGNGAMVRRSFCEGARIADGAQIGPYTHLRAGSDVGPSAEVGAFVQVKASTIGAGVKAHHLAYLGDASIGDGANIGAGAITANYDGVHKSRTVIGERAFIGTNATLVAPLTVADGAYVAAGSVVTDEVPAGALAVGRGRQHNSADWVLRRRAGTQSEVAARAAGAGSTARADDADPTQADQAGGAGA